MKYNVEILPAAWEDLKKIEDWYLINFDVETAIKVSDHTGRHSLCIKYERPGWNTGFGGIYAVSEGFCGRR